MAAWRELAKADLAVLAAEARRGRGGLTGWLAGSQYAGPVTEALAAAVSRLREPELPCPCEEVALPFLRALKQPALASSAFAALSRLLAADALSLASASELRAALERVGEEVEETTQLRALQASLALLQSPLCREADVRPLLALCISMLGLHGASQPVGATAAVCLRQGVDDLLERAAASHGGSRLPALAALEELLRVACDDNVEPLLRALATDVLEGALARCQPASSSRLALFAQHSDFRELLDTRLLPGLLLLLREVPPAILPPSSPGGALDEVGPSPAETARARLALRCSCTAARVFVRLSPQPCVQLLDAARGTSLSPALPAWRRCAALDALSVALGDATLVGELACGGPDGLALLGRLADAPAELLLSACGPGAPSRAAAWAALSALAAFSEGRARSDPSSDPAEEEVARAHLSCLALSALLRACASLSALAARELEPGGTPQLALDALDAAWQPLSSALQVVMSLGWGEALAAGVLAAHCALLRSAASLGAMPLRDALLNALCHQASAGAEGGVRTAEEGAPSSPRYGKTQAHAHADPSSDRTPVCARAPLCLLHVCLELAPALGAAGWALVIESLRSCDAALGAERLGGGPTARAQLAAALNAVFAAAAALPPGEQAVFLTALRDAARAELQDAWAALAALPSTPFRLLLLARLAEHVRLCGPQQRAQAWTQLEGCVGEAAAGTCAATQREALTLLGDALLAALPGSSGAAEMEAQLVGSLWRAAPPPHAAAEAREAALQALLLVVQRRGESLSGGWAPALSLMQAGAAAPEPPVVAAAFTAAHALAQHALPSLPDKELSSAAAAMEAFGAQGVDTNTALRAVGTLWDLADHVAREREASTRREVLPAALQALARLAGGDVRPEVRGSAVRALSACLQAHAASLPRSQARELLWETMLPVLRSALAHAQAAQTAEQAQVAAASGPRPARRGEPQLLVHHSRDRASKQWDETAVLSLQALGRLLHGRDGELGMSGSAQQWAGLTALLQGAACCASAEVASASLAALTTLATATAAAEAQHWAAAFAAIASLAAVAPLPVVRTEALVALTRLWREGATGADAASARLLLRASDAALALDSSPAAGVRAALEALRAPPPLSPALHAELLCVASAAVLRLAARASDAASSAPVVALHLEALEVLLDVLESAPAATRQEAAATVLESLSAAPELLRGGEHTELLRAVEDARAALASMPAMGLASSLAAWLRPSAT